MLRLPADLQLYIVSESGSLSSAQLVCKQFSRLLNTPESILRLYLSQFPSVSNLQLRPSSAKQLNSRQPSSTERGKRSAGSSGAGGSKRLQLVYKLLLWGRLRTWARSEDGAVRTIQVLCECASVVKALPQHQQHAVKAWQQRTGSSGSSSSSSDGHISTAYADLAAGVQLSHSLLPYAEHCLLPFCAAGGHVQLVKALLQLSHTPVLGHSMPHYVKTSAFLAAAAGGQVDVLAELLSAGALSWACQVPGASLTRTAMDLAAQGGHLQALKLLKEHVGTPSSTFLTAAAESGSGSVMEWALGFWFSQFNAVTGFSTAHIEQMHDALRVSCQSGHLPAIRQLLRYLHAVRCHDCCVLALSYTCCNSNTEAMRCILESPYWPQQLQRGGPKLLEQLVMVSASCLRIAVRIHSLPSLELLLDALTGSGSPLSPARELLGPQMPSVFDQAATAGNATALQLLLTRLPECYAALGMSALEGALSEGHTQLAYMIRTLLIMRGPEEGYTPEALSTQHNPNVARAERQGQLKSASSGGDVGRLQELLAGAAAGGPDDNEQLLMLRLAAAAGREEAVRLLLGEFGGAAGGLRAELCLRAVARGAVHAGQVALLQSFEADSSSLLLQHLSQPDTLAEYIRAALLCGRVAVAAWLVNVAARQQQLGVVRATLQSLLTASRWDLWNTGVGRTSHDAVASLLRALAAAPPAAETDPSAGDHAGAGVAASVNQSATTTPMQPVEGRAAAPAGSASSATLKPVREPLLTAQVLSLLLQASAGDPNMLYTVVDLVHSSWGITVQQDQQLHRQGAGELQLQRQQEQGVEGSSSVTTTGLQRQPSTGCEGGRLLASSPAAGGASCRSSPADPGSTASAATLSSHSWNTVASASTSSFTALYDSHSASPLRNVLRGPDSQACPDSQAGAQGKPCAGSWPMALGSSKSESRMAGSAGSTYSSDALWSDQQQVRESPEGAGLRWMGRVDGLVNGVGRPSNSSSSSSTEKLQGVNAVTGDMDGSPVHHPVHTPIALQKQKQQQQQKLKQQQPQQQAGSISGGVRSLTHLTGKVEQLSVAPPLKNEQHELPNYKCNLRADSQPIGSCYTHTYQPPVVLRTAVSVPLPSKACPRHPYMQYQQQQQWQQQHREQKQWQDA